MLYREKKKWLFSWLINHFRMSCLSGHETHTGGPTFYDITFFKE